jgi:inhibitor of cysteine peptidase
MKAFAIFSFALAAGLIAGCATTPGTKTLTVFDNNKQVNLAAGQTFVVELEARPTTGYRWDYQQEGNAALELVAGPRYQADATPSSLVGGSGREYFTFRAANAGQQTLKLEYHRPFEPDVAPVQTVVYNLVVGAQGQ